VVAAAARRLFLCQWSLVPLPNGQS